MKSQRRHELKDSDLAKELGRAGEFIKKNLRTLAMLLVITIAAIILVASMVNRRIEARQGEWAAFYELTVLPQPDAALAREGLRALAEDTSQAVLAAWAHVRIGEEAVSELVRRHYDLSDTERTALHGEARAAFDAVLTRYADQIRPVAKAHLGLGRLAEVVGELDAARQSYQAAADMESKGARLIALQALERLSQLDTLPPETPMAAKPEPEPLPVTQPATAPAPEPVAEPAAAPVAEPAPVPVAEPVAAPAPEPVAAPAPAPVSEPAPEAAATPVPTAE